MQQRIYVVTEKNSGLERLIMAQNPSQAIRHVANSRYEVKTASAQAVARLMAGGAQLEATRDEATTDTNVVSIAA